MNRRTKRSIEPQREQVHARASPPAGFPTIRWWAALAIAVCIAYAPALKAPFVFDDVVSIVDNTSIRRLWPPSVPLQPPSGGLAVSGRPVVNYTLAINHAANDLFGIDQRPGSPQAAQAASYRVVNIALHLFCGMLLFGIIARTLRSAALAAQWAGDADTIALIVTALWLLHPIQTEAVDYVVQRTELMVSACWVGALYASIRAWDARRRGTIIAWYTAAVVVCLLGMGSKEVMISAPLMVMLYDRAFRATSWRELLRARGLFYLLLAATSIWAIALIAGGPRADSVGFGLGIPWYRYLYSQAWAIGQYLRLVLWPHPLVLDYGRDPITGLRPIPGLIVLAVFGATTIWAWARAKRWGWLGFLGAWFFMLLAPSSSFVPIRTEIAAERRSYLALAAVFMLLVIGAASLLRRMMAGSDASRRRSALLRHNATWAIPAICLILGIVTFRRSSVYADPETLWHEVTIAQPQNARGYINLGTAISDNPQRLSEARSLFRKAIDTDSTLASAWINIAYVDTRQGDLSNAEIELRHAMTITDDRMSQPIAVERYGRVLLGMGETDRAVPYLERAATNHASDENFFWLGLGYLEQGHPENAVTALRHALLLNPERTDAMRLSRPRTHRERP